MHRPELSVTQELWALVTAAVTVHVKSDEFKTRHATPDHYLEYRRL